MLVPISAIAPKLSKSVNLHVESRKRKAIKVRQLLIARKISYFSLLSLYRICAIAVPCNEKWALFHRILPIIGKKKILAWPLPHAVKMVRFPSLKSTLRDCEFLIEKVCLWNHHIINYKQELGHYLSVIAKTKLNKNHWASDVEGNGESWWQIISNITFCALILAKLKVSCLIIFQCLEIESQSFIFQFPTQ